jgi:glycosyltransferase involved in cell wall biosynthesis
LNRPLKILTPLHSFEPGGVERVALRLNAAWVASGAEARVVLGRTDGAMRTEAPSLDYLVLRSGTFPTAAFETLWMLIRLPWVIRREQPDILFCAGNSYAVIVVAMRLLMGRRCPPIVAKISNDLARRDLTAPARWLYRVWLRIQGRYIDHFVGMAEPMRAEITSAMAVDSLRVSIIDDPALSDVDLARLEGLWRVSGESRAGRHFLSVGRLVSQKRFDILLAAFAQIAKHDDRLTILGEGPERAALQLQAARLGVTEQLILPGHANPIDPWLRDCDGFILSSAYEGVPAVIIEALAASLPIVATDCSVSMGDLLGHGRLGTLVAVGDIGALAEAMEKLEAQPVDRGACVRQAQRFTVERAAQAYLGVINGATGVRRLVPLSP